MPPSLKLHWSASSPSSLSVDKNREQTTDIDHGLVAVDEMLQRRCHVEQIRLIVVSNHQLIHWKV